jgi:enoyl reductase
VCGRPPTQTLSGEQRNANRDEVPFWHRGSRSSHHPCANCRLCHLAGGGDVQQGSPKPPQTSASGKAQGNTISAQAGAIVFDQSKNGKGSSTGPVTPVTDWTPPDCWFAPNYTPAQFKDWWTKDILPGNSGQSFTKSIYDRFQNGRPYKNWNLDKTGQGYWWTPVLNPDLLYSMGAAYNCYNQMELAFWADTEQLPTQPNAVNPHILSALAYAQLRVPVISVNLSPSGKQTVNLNTWAWFDKTALKPISVTASVPTIGISATTTATPVALHIDPGTPDATVYPASGNCPINPDGSIGTPYQPADGNNIPPCGLTYLHSTTSTGSFPFRATITWRITWTGTGGLGGNLPDGRFGQATPVTVQEVQTVVR